MASPEERGREDFELEMHPHEAFHDNMPSTAISSLPPVDRGRAAWLMLAAAFVTEMLLWGFPYSFGVLQSYYRSHPPLSENSSGISAVGTTCTGVMFLAAPIMTALMRKGPFFRKYSTFIGLGLVVLGISLSSLATTVWQLVLTQGIIYGIGCGLLYYPLLIFIDEWFITRKSLAYGVMWAGTSIGGLATPIMLEWGLNKYGVETFLRAWATALFVLIGPLLMFAKARVPWSGTSHGWLRNCIAGHGFLKMSSFWIMHSVIVIQGLGYFIPTVYLPDYASTVGLSEFQSSLMISILNAAGVPGVIISSLLCDHLGTSNVIFMAAAGSAASVFLFWGLSSASVSAPLLWSFAVLYGLSSGAFTATFGGIVQEIRRVAPEGSADTGSIFGVLMMARGIGNVACGPISEALLHGQAKTFGVVAYKSYYSPLVIFTGVTVVLSIAPLAMRQSRLF